MAEVVTNPDATPPQDEAQNLRYAEQLAMSLARKHYPEVPQFKPLSGDMFGLLSQIDNMTTGMVRLENILGGLNG